MEITSLKLTTWVKDVLFIHFCVNNPQPKNRTKILLSFDESYIFCVYLQLRRNECLLISNMNYFFL